MTFLELCQRVASDSGTVNGYLRAAGVRLGRDYPEPIIDLQRGRDRALAAFAQIRKAA